MEMEEMTYIAPQTSVTIVEVELILAASPAKEDEENKDNQYSIGKSGSDYETDGFISEWESDNGSTI